MVDMKNYKKKVHRSLLQREMMGGVPQAGLLFILVLGLVFIYGLEMYFTVIPLVLMYFVLRHFSKKDQWAVDVFLEHISQKDILIP
jgi:type IV secretory pathway TrbD component